MEGGTRRGLTAGPGETAQAAMATEERFYRPDELAREPHRLPAATYNLAYLLLKRSGDDCLFVPIRSIQYMAVLDDEEIIFVDREARSLIELSWQNFRPQERQTLEEPVPYQAVLYRDKARETLRHLQSEFSKALQQLETRMRAATSHNADIVPWPGRRP
ncbi:MAG TPA: hypothetical protein VKA76_04330 [Gammaproteobacteria bacterium]|nr:hypothetical protein [Gammaproteobacteria bacterium]